MERRSPERLDDARDSRSGERSSIGRTLCYVVQTVGRGAAKMWRTNLRRLFRSPVSLALALMCVMPAIAQTAAERVAEVPLIPREVLFGNPTRAGVQLSPDGTRLSWLAPVDGVLNIWVAPVDDLEAAQPVTSATARPISNYSWAFTNQHLLYVQDQNGDENNHVYSVNLNTHEVIDLTPLESIQARISEVTYKHPETILVGINDRNPQLHDLYRVNIETGERELVMENPGFVALLTDDELQVRYGLTFTPNSQVVVLKLDNGQPTEPILVLGPEDVLTTSPIGFTKDNQSIYLIDSRGRNTAALARLNPDTEDLEVLAEDPRADITGVLLHPTERTAQAAASTYEKTEWQVLDPALQADFDYLKGLEDGEMSVSDRTLDDQQWIVVYYKADGPVRYYLYDRANAAAGRPGEATFLFSHRPELEDVPLVEMHPVVIPSRDGLNLVSYLTLPPGSDPDGDGRPDQPLPMVLWIHGGPWSRDNWGYNPVHQWLANRGYAVMSVNYRGSTGFGKDFVNAANREWGAKMHDDVLDATDWAIAQGIAQADQVAITGGSYGGYETLVGLTFTPEKFAAGVDLVGVANMITWLENLPPYWVPIMPLMVDRVGDVSTEEGRAFLESRSPINFVDRIQRPLLIGQGANDPRVPQRESDQIMEAMQHNGLPVTYIVYADEGHGFARPENSLSFWAAMEAFLAQHLNGRFEPIGDAFAGTSATVVAGAEHVPGLAEAVRD